MNIQLKKVTKCAWCRFSLKRTICSCMCNNTVKRTYPWRGTWREKRPSWEKQPWQERQAWQEKRLQWINIHAMSTIHTCKSHSQGCKWFRGRVDVQLQNPANVTSSREQLSSCMNETTHTLGRRRSLNRALGGRGRLGRGGWEIAYTESREMGLMSRSSKNRFTLPDRSCWRFQTSRLIYETRTAK